MGAAALSSGLVTALSGLCLVAVCLVAATSRTEAARPADRGPPVVAGHALLAVTRLVFWVIYLRSCAGAPAGPRQGP
jgi:hypothetical protein